MTSPDIPDPRSIELAVEVPGTPGEVWDAIATGPGISAWMQPTEVDGREGGTFSYDMGSGPVFGTVTGWDPPRRFAQESRWELVGVSAEQLATEWIIQARSGGTCVVRMVMTGFGTGAEWDKEIGGMAAGMRVALDSLRRYLTQAGTARSPRAGQGPVTLNNSSAEEFQTVCLRKAGGAWKITHEHNSVPLYMDGTAKAATDLQP